MPVLSAAKLEANAKALLHRGQYNDAVLDELESQNDSQVEGMSAKVRMLKDVRHSFSFRCNLLAPSYRLLL